MQLQREQWTQAGTAMTAFGVATTGAFAMSAKAAVDWESSFAGVLKTVDGTPEQLAAIEEGLRGMARELPASHAEIAAVAEAAGQLGIQTDHVLGFTRTMIDLGEATNMSADEAATSLARFVNIMGSSQSEFSNIGSAVVELGNNFATTESEIVAMSMRLAGAGAQIGLSEAEVLALATAMSSLGIEAEAGGTAMSQTMIQMRNAVDEGGESLEAFATAAGMSSEAFSQLFRESPAEAIQAVVTGLGEMEAQGINTSSVLSDMGATGLRQSDALRRLSGDATILGDAFRMATQAYRANSALADEAAQRYETVASKVAMAKNSIVDAAISMGSVFMPAIAEVAEWVGKLAGGFADLPDPMQNSIAIMGSLAGLASLAAGGFLLLAPRVMDTVIAFQTLSGINLIKASGGIKGIMTSLGKIAGYGAAVGVIAVLADSVTGINQLNPVPVEDLAEALTNVGTHGRTASTALSELMSSKNSLGPFKADVKDLTGLLDELAPRWESAFGDGIGDKFDRVMDPGKLERIHAEIALLDEALAAMVDAGNAGEAAAIYEELFTLMASSGATVDEVAAAFERYHAAVGGGPESTFKTLAGELLGATDATEGLAGATDELAGANSHAAEMAERLGISEEALAGIYDSQLGSIQDIISARRELIDSANSIVDAERNHQNAIDGMIAAIEDESIALDRATGRWDGYTTAGQQAHDASREFGNSMYDLAVAWDEQGVKQDEIISRLATMREDYIDMAMRMGATREQAEALADTYDMFPETIATDIDVDTAPAMHKLNDFTLVIDETTGEISIGGRTVDAEAKLAELLGIVNVSNGEIEINGDTYPADMTLNEWLEVVEGTETYARLNADDFNARQTLNSLMNDVDVAYEEVDIGGDDTIAQGDLFKLLTQVDGSEEDIKIGGNTLPAIKDKDHLLGVVSQSESAIKVNANTSPFYNSVGSILNKTIGTAVINVATRQSGGSIRAGIMAGFQARAEGGYTPPGWTLVGEEGPELVNFTAPSRVYTADETAQVFQAAWSTPMASDYRAARHGAPPTVNVGAPSLEGLTLQGQIKIGDAIVPLMDARIVRADKIKKTVGRRP